jgi:hypothetical protein
LTDLFFSSSAAGPYDNAKSAMPRLAEEEEQMLGGPGNAPPTRRQQPPTLPPMPSGLTPEQLKRRHIVASLVHSENNYVASLQRLVNVRPSDILTTKVVYFTFMVFRCSYSANCS